jgi:DNA transformation protein
MALSETYRELVEDRLGACVPALKTKRMFGGLGIWSGSHFFALIDDDVLYFKVDDASRTDYEALRMKPFCPYGDPKMVMGYYQVPDEIFADPHQLREWASKAMAVAKSKPAKKARPKKKPP